jgi:hypothetical protein
MSYDKAKHLVELDEKILAVFIVDSTKKIQELFIAKDADIDRSIVESVKSILDLSGNQDTEYIY